MVCFTLFLTFSPFLLLASLESKWTEQMHYRLRDSLTLLVLMLSALSTLCPGRHPWALSFFRTGYGRAFFRVYFQLLFLNVSPQPLIAGAASPWKPAAVVLSKWVKFDGSPLRHVLGPYRIDRTSSHHRVEVHFVQLLTLALSHCCGVFCYVNEVTWNAPSSTKFEAGCQENQTAD